MLYPWPLALPFIVLLLTIALAPLFCPHFWEKNKNRAWVTLLISLPTLYFIFQQGHYEALLHSLHEYASFLCLVGSLYVISGGIALKGNLEGSPRNNALLLLAGSALASLIGTTGASMLLIRLFLKTNSEREHTWHLPLFFIFSVSNFGGLLTPLGDPPLFLGFLNGVPFQWTLGLWPEWLLSISYLLVIFYFWDRRAYQREETKSLRQDRQHQRALEISGGFNLALLLGVMACIFLPSPFRELGMLALSLASYFGTRRQIHRFNEFSFGPILEVAILFAGIFVTMVPVLGLLQTGAPRLGLTQPWQYFWATGLLSSFLDNAPTYLTFFNIAKSSGLHEATLVAGVPDLLLRAISLGAVWMGANTYIGNGPNFMVKAIADAQGYKTPNFLSYFLISALILGPLYAAMAWLFL